MPVSVFPGSVVIPKSTHFVFVNSKDPGPSVAEEKLC